MANNYKDRISLLKKRVETFDLFELNKNDNYKYPEQVANTIRGNISILERQIKEIKRRLLFNKTHGKQK